MATIRQSANLSNTSTRRNRQSVLYTPLLLFAQGEQGVWYDPSDMSTLFQDAAGTTPVTAVEQPVGLMLDKSKGLVLGPDLIPSFSASTFPFAFRGTVSSSGSNVRLTTTEVSGGIFGVAAGTADPLIPLSNGSYGVYEVTIVVAASSVANASHYLSVRMSAGANSGVREGLVNIHAPGVYRGLLNFDASASMDTVTLRSEGGSATVGDWWEISSFSLREVSGNHASQPTATSRPVLRQDGNGKHYLYFDGVDDFLVTPSIDFTGTDKMTVCAGVRKLSDAVGAIVELSPDTNTYNGASAFFWDSSGWWRYSSKGTVMSNADIPAASGAVTGVLSGLGDISGDRATLRVNGAQVAQSITDQGAGNFGNYPLYIGRRGGTTFPFNGRLYSLLIAGRLLSDRELTSAEKYANDKTRAYQS